MAIAAEDWINEQKRNFFKFTGRERPSDDAVFILVMGMTGSGKSTFIAQATGKDVTVRHGLSSCTSGISIYNGKVDGRSVYLIDTPGFDDTHVSDFDTIQTLATYLSISYHRNVYVHGIVLLHSIASSRITGSARRAIAMFQALCGPTTNSNVALATTFWASSSEPRSLLKAREGQLVSDESFFGPIAAGGARAFRHAEHGLPSGPASARRIVSHLIKQARVAPVVLNIQHELVNKRLRLDQTAAGRIALGAAATVVSATKHRIEDIRAELCRASQRNDSDTVGALMEVKLDLDQRLADVAAANRKLALNMQEMAALEQSLLLERLDKMESYYREDLARKQDELYEMEEELARRQSIIMGRSSGSNGLASDAASEKNQSTAVVSKRKEVEDSQNSVAAVEKSGGSLRKELIEAAGVSIVSGVATGLAGAVCSIM